jgi:glycine dehydrogenase subunit 1
VSTYTSTTAEDLEAMLAEIGVASLQELFDRQIPAAVRLQRALDLPAGMAEQDVYAHLRALAGANTSAEDEVTFLGAGMYDHYVPAVVDMLMGRSEFLTPYTPYQPEISQGGLQVMFEYQTAISELTALPVSNASVYEGPSAVAAAAYLAKLANGKPRVVVSRGVHPHSRAALRTLAAGYGHEIVEVGLRDGVTDPDAWAAAIDQDTSAVVFQQPNFLGAVEDAEALAGTAKGSPAVVVGSYDPIPLGILKPPGECGVDVAVGEGQTLGNRLDFGGPSFGFFAATEAYLRRMPGRIAGETRDVDGRRGFVLTLQTREQHIRREKATSNICTAQALNALAGVVYLSWLGRRGLVELGELLLQRTHYAREALTALDGVEALHEQPVVREFAVRLDAPVQRVIARCQDAGVNPGFALGREYEEHPDGLLVAITEQRSKADIDRLVDVLGAAVTAERGQTPALAGGSAGVGARAPRPRPRCSARPRRRSSRRAPRGGGPSPAPSSTCPRSTGCCPTPCAAPSRRGCPRCQSPSSCATTSTSPSATSTSTRASIRSARAR